MKDNAGGLKINWYIFPLQSFSYLKYEIVLIFGSIANWGSNHFPHELHHHIAASTLRNGNNLRMGGGSIKRKSTIHAIVPSGFQPNLKLTTVKWESSLKISAH